MFENLTRPTISRAASATEIRALNVPTEYWAEVFVFEGAKPLAVLSWSPGCQLDDSPADGIFKPSALELTDPGRWVFSRFLTCGVGW